METADQQEIIDTLHHLLHEFEDLAVGGLRAVGPERIKQLDHLKEAFERAGSLHLAKRLGNLADAIREDSRTAGDALMRAQASVRMFDRILTLEVVEDQLKQAVELAETEDQ